MRIRTASAHIIILPAVHFQVTVQTNLAVSIKQLADSIACHHAMKLIDFHLTNSVFCRIYIEQARSDLQLLIGIGDSIIRILFHTPQVIGIRSKNFRIHNPVCFKGSIKASCCAGSLRGCIKIFACHKTNMALFSSSKKPFVFTVYYVYNSAYIKFISPLQHGDNITIGVRLCSDIDIGSVAIYLQRPAGIRPELVGQISCVNFSKGSVGKYCQSKRCA